MVLPPEVEAGLMVNWYEPLSISAVVCSKAAAAFSFLAVEVEAEQDERKIAALSRTAIRVFIFNWINDNLSIKVFKTSKMFKTC